MTNTVPDTFTELLPLMAGINSQGEPIVEQVKSEVEDDGVYKACHSPLFVRNLAQGDRFTLSPANRRKFSITERSGKLALRIFRKSDINELEQWLTPQVEKLDGSLDLTSDHALVYSLHVNIGFHAVEELLDNAVGRFTDTVWYYGNVYDPQDGTTPLVWWNDFINQT